MNTVIDPWVVHYERLMEILDKARVIRKAPPKRQKKFLMWNRKFITMKELKEALLLFKEVYPEEFK